MDFPWGMQIDPHFGTKAVHVGQDPNQWNSRAVIPLISLSATFQQKTPGDENGYSYSRQGNPTRSNLEECIASLENGKYGLCFSSGMGAITTILTSLSAGDHIICGDDVYGGTNRIFQQVMPNFNIEFSFVDVSSDPENVRKAIRPHTKMIWIESPTNPTMKLVDIKAMAKIAKLYEGRIITVVDNTFMSPYFQRPLELGIDVVVHSLTKYMNGHSDVVMGAIVTRNEAIFKKLKFLQNAIGAVPSPFDCFLVNRGLKTLHLRMREHMKNAMAVAKYLEKHPSVEKVVFPGLPSHPQHKLAVQQCSGFSGMLSFYIKGGLEEAKTFLSHLKCFILAESLGGVESLASIPALMTHAGVPDNLKAKVGLTNNLIRLSVGVESETDLINDLDQALRKAVKL